MQVRLELACSGVCSQHTWQMPLRLPVAVMYQPVYWPAATQKDQREVEARPGPSVKEESSSKLAAPEGLRMPRRPLSSPAVVHC